MNKSESSRSTPPSDAIKPKQAPGAYLLESTKDNAEYWANGARELAAEGKDIEEVMQCYMQATNAWRNAAYGLAEKLHFAGYDQKLGTVAVSEKTRRPRPGEGTDCELGPNHCEFPECACPRSATPSAGGTIIEELAKDAEYAQSCALDHGLHITELKTLAGRIRALQSATGPSKGEQK